MSELCVHGRSSIQRHLAHKLRLSRKPEGGNRFVGTGICACLILLLLACESTPELELVDSDCPETAVAALAYTAPAPRAGIRHYDVHTADEDLDERRLTDEGASYNPTFSPDGSRIAFVSGRDGGWEECCGFDTESIYVMNADGSEQQRITMGPHDGEPAWSPTGDRIAFVRGSGANPSVWVMDADGTNEEELMKGERNIGQRSPAWSPDGEQIAFIRDRFPSGRSELWTMNSDGSNALRLAGADEGIRNLDRDDWSSDGSSLAVDYHRKDWQPQVGILELEDLELRRLAVGVRGGTWTPDGEHLTYIRYRAEYYEMKVSTVEGEGRESLPPSALRRKPYEPFTFDWAICD
jgi:Tol biopolymer transport system component